MLNYFEATSYASEPVHHQWKVQPLGLQSRCWQLTQMKTCHGHNASTIGLIEHTIFRLTQSSPEQAAW